MTREDIMKKAYVERDISWMYFNHRILQEAEKEAELTDQRYSSKDVLKAMKDAIGGERVV